jgi:hypothetical protein
MARDEPITYEELSAEHKQRYDEHKTMKDWEALVFFLLKSNKEYDLMF